MNKIILALFFMIFNNINNCSDTVKKWSIKFNNHSQTQNKIHNIDTLLHALNLLIKHEHKGYLMREDQKIHLCVWDKSFGMPKSIHPFYKGTIEIVDTHTQGSENVFAIKREDLQEIESNLAKGSIMRSPNYLSSLDKEIDAIIKILLKIQLLIQI